MTHQKYWRKPEHGSRQYRRSESPDITPLSQEEWLARGWKPAPEEQEQFSCRSNIKPAGGGPQAFATMLEQMADETVWLPTRINRNGTIENVTQAYIKVKGAEKGESNFKKQQEPAKKGCYSEGSSLGTYVMNLHPEIQRLDTKEIDVDAKILRYGKRVKRRYLSPQERIFAEAAEQAAMILRENPDLFSNKNSTAQSTSTEAERTLN